ncbi:hypothetical protein AVEN_93512-1 [Araneus ventricosus]|uniref:Uncharacterized protein n=1 Tax=Araneus ventricosus TaxID=182803 RepID=A0A4Y2APB1_ARAVE|nr:hypothetical protein AVEN_93512-1 [Araneus ventricosus]
MSIQQELVESAWHNARQDTLEILPLSRISFGNGKFLYMKTSSSTNVYVLLFPSLACGKEKVVSDTPQWTQGLSCLTPVITYHMVLEIYFQNDNIGTKLVPWVYGENRPTSRIMENGVLFTNIPENTKHR